MKFPALPASHEFTVRDGLLKVSILPMVSPPVESAVSALDDLKLQATAEGLNASMVTWRSRLDERQAHLCLVEGGHNRHIPVGLIVFTKEIRREGFSQWWLTGAWINPAQRRQGLFTGSLPYLHSWHPKFEIQGDPVAMTSAVTRHRAQAVA